MLGKLLKYDWKSFQKKCGILFLGLFLLGLITLAFRKIAGANTILSIPEGFITGIYVIALIGLPFLVFYYGFNYFYQTMIKDEGYLTHTLPVKKSSLILSKGIVANVFLLLSVMVSVGCFFLVFGNQELLDGIVKLYDTFIKEFTLYSFILTIVTMVVSFVIQYFMITLSIALGQTKNVKKGMYSFIYFFILYTVSQIVASLVIFGYALFDSKMMTVINNDNMMNMHYLNILLWIGLITNIIFGVIYYFGTVRLFERKLNLE